MFTARQVQVLRQPLTPHRVYTLHGNSYLAAWEVRAHLTRIFGYGNWDFAVKELTQCDQWATHNDKGEPTRFWATYRAIGCLTVRGADGMRIATYEDAAVGEAQNQTSSGAAHDLAVKSAVSGALKRCAVNLGTQFGLSLYAGTLNDVIVKLVSDDDETPIDTVPTVEGEGNDQYEGDYA